MYYAHSKEADKKYWEELIVHLKNVAETCEKFAAVFGCEKMGTLAGLLHDLGKYSKEFQHRLEGARVRVDHSTAGAVEAGKRYDRATSMILQYLIAGHHAGLPNYGSINETGSLAERLNKKIADYSAFEDEIILPDYVPKLPDAFLKGIKEASPSRDYGLFFLIKMLFSCLVDADFLETERFFNPELSKYRDNRMSIQILAELFHSHMEKLQRSSDKTELNKNRQAIFEACVKMAEYDIGLFSLTVPTGGGKTLASMAFALRHAIKHGLDRIIYVIPYTSIIEQTAEIFRAIFGAEYVLEHHSNFDYTGKFDYENSERKDIEQLETAIKLATENWDLPIIVTTNVQFFESIYSNKTSKMRKVHNIANSVIIFDEAQMLPMNYLIPSLECICELTDKYHASAILCTATQPAIEKYVRNGITISEIVSDAVYNRELFKRVEYSSIGSIDIDALGERIAKEQQALCVVNSRADARELYDRLPEENRFHLSGYMCAAHRSEKLKEIREKLEKGELIHVVTTQLIEAGVDIDFPVVYRELAGVDSIIQAAGRCNREGKRPMGNVFIFQIEERKRRGYLARTASYGEETIRKYTPAALDSTDAIRFYFERIFSVEELDKNDIMNRINEIPLQYPFKDIAQDYKLIENTMVSIIVPYNEEAKQLIEQLSYNPSGVIRKLQRYTVNVYGTSDKDRVGLTGEYQTLVNNGGIKRINEIYHILNYEEESFNQFYSSETGIVFEGNNGIW
jgi:CRISPR-associated endonuclease/helicase Cas3